MPHPLMYHSSNPSCNPPPLPPLPPPLQGPEDEERVNPVILRSLQTAEDAFMSFDSSATGHIDKKELMGMMHEVGAHSETEISVSLLGGWWGGRLRGVLESFCLLLVPD